MEKLKVKFSVDYWNLPEKQRETVRKNEPTRYSNLMYPKSGVVFDRYRGSEVIEDERFYSDRYLILGDDDHTYHIDCSEVSIIKQ